MSANKIKYLTLLLVSVLILAGCQKAGPAQTPTASVETQAPIPSQQPTPTPAGSNELNICLGDEPQTLYLYGGSSKAQWSILDAVYDGPYDSVNYQYQPTIMESVPSLDNGGEVIEAVDATLNMIAANVRGEPVILVKGTRVLPAGCRDESCAVEWDGKTALQMDQQTLTYKFKPGILWSDGQPLTADDSLFSYEIAANPETKINPVVIARTASYVKVDEVTVQWKGIPGYISADPVAYFFLPLPRHALKDIPVAELAASEAASVKPLGWGPYAISAWEKGKQITLQANDHYFGGVPAQFTTLVFKFLGPNSDNNLFALANGQCDVIAETTLLEDQLSSVRNMELEKVHKVYTSLGPEVEYLQFGVDRVSADGNPQPASLVSDLRTRQGIVACIDRKGLSDQLFNSYNAPASGFYAPDHPAYAADAPRDIFNPSKGQQLLDDAGWKDNDSDSETPRVAAGIEGVTEGTPLVLNYFTTKDGVRTTAAQKIQADLKTCGVQVNITALDPGELFAPGPSGPVFGRMFDLAQFSWSSGRTSPCSFYTTAQIPSPGNDWMGINVTGLASVDYDTACQKAISLPVSDPAYLEAQKAVQQQYLIDLPSLPLYYQVHVSSAKPEVCGIQPSSSARSEFWNIERWSWSANCPSEP